MLAALALLVASPASAAPVTYACSFVEGEQGDYSKIDQAIVDIEAGHIELREAKTIGTSKENRLDYRDGDFRVKAYRDQKEIGDYLMLANVAPQYVQSMAFHWTPEPLAAADISLNFATASGNIHFRWSCKR